MPETPDWSAAPQAVVQWDLSSQLVTETGALLPLGLSLAGRTIVVVGFDLATDPGVSDQAWLRGQVAFALYDVTTTVLLLSAAISPSSPFATNRPPFGSVRASSGADIGYEMTGAPGTGTQLVLAALYYYYE